MQQQLTRVTHKQSQQIAQELLFHTFSCISYLRGLFPEECFESHDYHGTPIKRLQPSVNGPADTLIQWLTNGCFDALEKRYTIILGVYLDADKPNDMVETYTFHISYPNDQPEISLRTTIRNGNNQQTVSQQDIRKSTTQLIRTLLVLMQTLKPLPDTRYLGMKLHYYDDRTPADYEPPMFRAGSMEDAMFYFCSDPTKMKIGQVNSGHHCVDVKMHSVMDDDNADDSSNEEQRRETEQEERMKKAVNVQVCTSQRRSQRTRQTANRQASISSVPKSNQQQSPRLLLQKCEENQVVVVEEEQQLLVGGDSVVVPEEVDCACQDKETDLGMIQCEKCMKWQHMYCSGFRTNEMADQVKKYHCLKCEFDSLKWTFNQKTAIQDLCWLRRGLIAAVQDEFVSQRSISVRFNCTMWRAQKLCRQLEMLGVISYRSVQRSQPRIKVHRSARTNAIINDHFDRVKLDIIFNPTHNQCFVNSGGKAASQQSILLSQSQTQPFDQKQQSLLDRVIDSEDGSDQLLRSSDADHDQLCRNFTQVTVLVPDSSQQTDKLCMVDSNSFQPHQDRLGVESNSQPAFIMSSQADYGVLSQSAAGDGATKRRKISIAAHKLRV